MCVACQLANSAIIELATDGAATIGMRNPAAAVHFVLDGSNLARGLLHLAAMFLTGRDLELSPPLSERLAFAAGSATIGLGTLGLSILGGSLILQPRRRLRPLAIVLASLVAALACAQLVLFWSGLPPLLDRLLVDSSVTKVR